MSRRLVTRFRSAAVLGAAAAAAVGAAAAGDGEPPGGCAVYAQVLERFVTPAGEVRYRALAAQPEDLHRFVSSLATVREGKLGQLPREERIAFWINAYNAITLATVVEAYPIQPRGFAALRYPASSIRQIPGAWTRRRWTVAGNRVSLDDIEHRILRKRFHEPRIHMALVCAARGCPPLRTEPYRGVVLSRQLDDQARRYLASPAGLRVDPARRTVWASAIFKWFRKDFEAVGGVRAFLRRYAPEPARSLLSKPGVKIRSLDYDWALNEARGGSDVATR